MEIYKKIIGYENYYISNMSNVINAKNNKTKLLKIYIPKDGYSSIVLYKNNNRKMFNIHRLVALAFIPNPQNKPCVNHINGIKNDNRIENLEWCSYSENEIHSKNILNKKYNGVKGVKNHNNKLKERDVFEIRKSNLSQRTLAKKYNVCKSTIKKILDRKSWNHI
jgi:hypothetical protein